MRIIHYFPPQLFSTYVQHDVILTSRLWLAVKKSTYASTFIWRHVLFFFVLLCLFCFDCFSNVAIHFSSHIWMLWLYQLRFYSVYTHQINQFLANITATMGLSVVVSAVFEVPLLTLEKHILPSRQWPSEYVSLYRTTVNRTNKVVFKSPAKVYSIMLVIYSVSKHHWNAFNIDARFMTNTVHLFFRVFNWRTQIWTPFYKHRKRWFLYTVF